MLNAHDTIVTAQYQESSDPYTTDGAKVGRSTAPIPYRKVCAGTCSRGDTFTFSEPVSSKTGTPYSQKVAIDATTQRSTVFLRKDGNTYRISAPSLCLQPVQAVSFWGTETIRKINWLCGATRTTVTPMNGGERFTVYTTGYDATPQDQFLNEIAWSDTSRESVNFLYALVHVIHEYEGDTVASMLERSDGVMAADITAISDPIRTGKPVVSRSHCHSRVGVPGAGRHTTRGTASPLSVNSGLPMNFLSGTNPTTGK